MTFILAAHGTRKPGGIQTIRRLGEQVAATLDRPVHVGFVDVLGPTPGELLTGPAAGGPAVLVPAFLSRGYHVRRDVPSHVAASGHPDVTVATALGPCPGMVRILFARLVESGWRPGHGVVVAAAGTSDLMAQRDLRRTTMLLSLMTGARAELAFASGEPAVSAAVAGLRGRGVERVGVASYLLADGLFLDRLQESGADTVSEPLGTHPDTVRLIANRFRRARLSAA